MGKEGEAHSGPVNKYCPAFGLECVLNGCFFDKRLKEITPEYFTPEEARETEQEIIENAFDMGCPFAGELKGRF